MQVRLNSTLRGQTGRRAVEIDLPAGVRVREALDAAVAELPALALLLFDADGRLRDNIIIFRNGRNVEFFEGLETRLEAGHNLDLFPRSGAQRAFATD